MWHSALLSNFLEGRNAKRVAILFIIYDTSSVSDSLISRIRTSGTIRMRIKYLIVL